MNKRLITFLVGIILILTSLLLASKQPIQEQEPEKPQVSPESQEEATFIARVIDGDTIEVDGKRVRYIGIDTPEPDQCLGDKATEANKKLVEGKELELEQDIEKFDKYGRTLAYVWVQGELVNEELVMLGLATVTTYPPNVKYVDRFTAAQKEARENKRGLWADNACPVQPSTTATPTSTSSNSVQGAQANCAIKGNISSSGEKIYHVPGQRYYERTKIEGGKGERWFCSEDEAVESGWRKAKI